MKQSRKRTKRTLAVIAAVLVVVMSLVMLVRQTWVQVDTPAKDIYQYRKINVSYGCWAGDYSNLGSRENNEMTQRVLWLSTAILASIVATTLIARNQKDRLGREYQTL